MNPHWVKDCAAVIPCLDEEATIGHLVPAVRVCLEEVIVVDDGSADRTAELAEKAGANVLRHKTTRGKGSALQTGWRHALNAGFKWVVSMDGDGQHSPEDIPAFFRCAEEKPVPLVVGNRMSDGEQMPWLRRHVNRWMSNQLSGKSGRPLPDSQCGFRLMNLEAWSALPITTTHFETESEVLLAFLAAGHAVEFVPIQVIYKNEQSKIAPFRDTVRWLRWFAKV